MEAIERTPASNPLVSTLWHNWFNTTSTRIFYLLVIVTLILWNTVPDTLFPSVEAFASAHVILELFSVVVSCLIFTVCWYSPNQTNTTIAGAILFLVIAILDTFHFLSYAGMPDFGSPNSGQKSLIFWFAARYVSIAAITLILLRNEDNNTFLARKRLLLGLAIFLTLGFGVLAARQPDLFPEMYSSSSGLTSTKIILEYILIFFLIGIAFFIVKRNVDSPSPQDKTIFVASIILACSEFIFTLYGSLSDFAIFSGHIYKAVAYGIIFQAVFVTTIKKPYEELIRSEKILKRLANIVSLNRNEKLYDAVCNLLFDKTHADHIFIVKYDSRSRTIPIVASYYKNGFPETDKENSDVIRFIIDNKLDRRNIMQSGITSTIASTTGPKFKNFIAFPLLSERKGNVGSIIIASTKAYSLKVTLKEILFIVSTRLASEFEEIILEEDAKKRKSDLARKLETAREEERKTIARDIHDDLGGSLAALKIDISLLNKRVKRSSDDEEVLKKLSTMNQVVDKSISDMRNIINNLRLGILDDIGILEAVEWKLSETGDRHNILTTLETNIQSETIDANFDEISKTSLFRMISEAITNVIKHANADRLSVKMDFDSNNLVTKITDNGKGIAASNIATNSYGILGMQERTDLLGGSLSISSPVEGGTQIEIRIPCTTEKK